MHKSEEQSSKIDNNRILFIDDTEIGSNGIQSIEKDWYHKLRESKQHDNKKSLGIENELCWIGLHDVFMIVIKISIW